MPEYAGSATVTQWIWSGGTITMSAEERTVNVNPSIELYDATAGASGSRERLGGVKDANIVWQGVAQDSTTALLSGTAYATALKEGNVGTVIVAPYGTVAGSLKYTLPAISMGSQLTSPYANVSELAVTFTNNTSAGLTTGNY